MGRGSYWKDPERAERAVRAMKDSWRMRRHFVVEWPTGETKIFASLEEVAPVVGRSAQTLRIYMAQGKGEKEFMQDGELLTLRRVER
jgi:hypothetical protein